MNTTTLMPAAGSWLVAQCRTPRGATLMSVAFDEIDRQRNWLTWQLRPFNLSPGGSVLLITGSSAIWPMAALQQSLLDGMLLPTFAESSAFDWYRTAAILRQFKLAALFNLNLELLDALAQNASDAWELLRKVPVIFAEPAAKQRLAQRGIVAYGMLNLGATLAVECPQRLGLHVDGREWQLESIDGEVHISSVLPRLHAFERFATGVRAHVEASDCACGSPDWRLLLSTG